MDKKKPIPGSTEPDKLDPDVEETVRAAEAIARGEQAEPGAPNGGASPGPDGSAPDNGAPGAQPTDTIDLQQLGVTQELIGEVGCMLPPALASWIYGLKNAPPVEEPLRSVMQKSFLLAVRDLAPSLEQAPPWMGYLAVTVAYVGLLGLKAKEWTTQESGSSLVNQGAENPPS